uniref:Uncharacterized protein n=1 Tax=Anguilla anguilla TaxID=7936 RepID=A0A0E9XR55_ANGAN
MVTVSKLHTVYIRGILADLFKHGNLDLQSC